MGISGLIGLLFVWGSAAGESKLPEGVLAVVDGRKITVDDYKEYLFRSLGTSRLQDYIDVILLEKKAKELGVTIPEEEVRKRVEDEIQRQVESFFKGDVARWRPTLKQRGWTEDDYRAYQAWQTRIDLLRSKCVLKTRKVTEEKIRERFERLYGKNGISYQLRHILFSTRRRGSRKPDPEFEAKAREKAERVLRELRDGADFEEMVNLYSDDLYTKKRGGRIPRYRPNMYGSKEFDDAVAALSEPGQISGIVKSRRGFHIIQLISRKVTKYEDVKDEIRKLLVEEKPSPREKYEFTKKLREEAKIVR